MLSARRILHVVMVIVSAGVLVLISPVAPSATAGTARGQRIESWTLPSPLVDTRSPGGRLADGRTVPKVNVLLPAGYDNHPRRHYPVLWLLHGAGGGTNNWLGPNVPVARDFAGFPGIIVMPDGGVFGMYLDWWNNGHRGEPAWARYHLTVLKKAVEHRYRIRPARRWHAIAGISMGGQGALRYAEMLPGYFGSVAAFSAAVPDMQSIDARLGVALMGAVDGASAGAGYSAMFGPSRGPYAEGNSPAALVGNLAHTRVFLSSGNGINCPQDPVNLQSIVVDTTVETVVSAQQRSFARSLRAIGAPVTAVSTCGVHTFGVWDRAIAAARRWGMFARPPRPSAHWDYRTIATSGVAWSLAFRFQRPPEQVALFERRGARLSGRGASRVRFTGHGCGFTRSLPFSLTLPRACR